MDDTPTTLLVAEHDDNTRAFLLDNLAADGYEPLGAQTEEETRVKLRNHGAALVWSAGSGTSAGHSPSCGRSARATPAATPPSR
jgi:hypothetical protein